MDKAEDSNLEVKPNLQQGLDILQDQNKDQEIKNCEAERCDNQNKTQGQNDSNQEVKSTNAQVQNRETVKEQKKLAMNKMRNSIKETLFKGITKKINPEGSSQNIAPQNNGSQNNIQQQFSQSGILGKGQNFNEQDQSNQNQTLNAINDENQTPLNDEDSFKLQQVLTNSVKMEQCPRIEFNFTGSNNSNKVRMNDPIINKIFEEQKPQKDSSIINQTRFFEENYELIGEKLGEGSQGDVRKCRHKKSQQIYAVKMIRNGDTEIILSAITSFQIAKNLNHPSVIKPYELFINQETEKIYYVMEYCEYGSLQDYIENIWSLSPHKRDHRSMSKMKTTSTDNLEDESNSLDSQKNLDFEGASSRVTKKSRKSPRKHKKKKQEEEKNEIKICQQLGSSDRIELDIQNITDQDQSALNNDSTTTAAATDKTDSQQKIEVSEEKSVRNKSQKRKVQFNSSQSKIYKDQVKRILKEILIAVDYLHSEGICHRDLKPDNILISNDLKDIKIIDFEISKRFKYFRQNKTGVLKVCEMWTRTGTLDFQSPEMFESAGYTEAVDIWAIGVIAYYLLTGRLPFDQEYISDKIEFIRDAKYNLEYIVDLDDVSKDFIRRMLKKDPAERLTAWEALQHPWFLVCNDVRNKNELNLNLNKSTVLNLFHSPQDSDKGSFIDSKKYMELNLIKGNQSTVLVKKDSNGSETTFPQQMNFFYNNKMQSQKNSYSNDLRSKNYQSKLYFCNRYEGSADNLQMKNEDPRIISESSKFIGEVRRNSRPHNTQIESPSKIRSNQDQFSKQSCFYDKTIQQSQGDNSSKMLKSNNYGNINVTKFGEDFANIKEAQCGESSCTNMAKTQIHSESEQEDESEKDDSLLRKKKEYKMKLQRFKEQMTTGMSDLPTKFIHINQKQQKTPQTSQLRLRLLQEKNRVSQQGQQPIQQSQQSNQESQEINKQTQINQQNTQIQIGSTQQNTTAVASNMTVFNSNQNQNSNTNSQISAPGGHSSNLCSPIQYTENMSTANPNINFTQFQLNNNNNNLASTSIINNNNNNSNNNSTFGNKNEVQFNLPSTSSINTNSNIFSGPQQQQDGVKQLTLQQNQSNQSAGGVPNQAIQHFIDNAEIEVQPLRSRSNTNDVVEKVESEEQIETRAKRMSEDFTSSCIVSNPQKQVFIQPNLNSSIKNGNQNDGKVMKSSHFSNNQYTLANSLNSQNLINQQSSFTNKISNQLSIQERLEMKSKKYVQEFLLSTGNLQENPSSLQQIQSKESVGVLETSINPIFKKIESDDETPQNDYSVKKAPSLNSSNLCQFQSGINRSNSDICSIASEKHINHNEKDQNDHAYLDDIIQSSSEESFQIDETDDFQNNHKAVQVQPQS